MRNSTIHRLLIKSSVEKIESLMSEQTNSVSEEDIRTILLKSDIAPRTILFQKEQENRTDLVIRNKTDNSLRIRYELKTYIKDSETLHYGISSILNDFRKLHDQRGNEDRYFVLVCRRDKLDERPINNASRILKQMSFIYNYPDQNVGTQITIVDDIIACKAYSVMDRQAFVIYTWKVL